MTYETFAHEADIGIRGMGSSIERAFEEAAKAMFDVEVDIKKVQKKRKVRIKCAASNIEELFVEWLNALLTQASLRGMVFSGFKVKIIKGKLLELEGYASGEKLDAERHNIKDEVKGATYSQLRVELKKRKWIAQCIVDV
ncbi:MAG: archease [Candidatus Pacearchaeota archaeon]|nr:archease [Candidatus Pacearchaeota archaeon]